VTYFAYRGIELQEPLQVLDYRKEQVFAGPDYLYDRHTLTVKGYYNPASTSYRRQGALNAPVPVAGVRGPETETAVRNWLSQARGQLIYSVGGVEVLRSPAQGATVDAANGPVPVVQSVVAAHGEKTFEVTLTITTCVNEGSSTSPLLSNRWRMVHDIDQDGYTTRTVIGHAVFRSDRLAARNAAPDDFRAYLFFPIPNNCRRNGVHVEQSEDGLEVAYSFTDQETAVNIIAPGVTRIEAYYTNGFRGPGGDEAGYQFARSGLQLGIDIAGALGFGGHEKLGDATRIGKGLLNTLDTVRNNVPRLYHSVVARAWGNRTATRTQLYAVALQIARFKVSAVGLAMGQADASSTQDLMGRFVEVKVQMVTGPVQSIIDTGLSFISNLAPPEQNDGIPGVTNAADGPGQASPPFTDGTARGTYLEKAVAAVLLAADATPPRPAGPPPAQNLQP
jgi:peptidoglycan hydrolase-like protein with peptidoglycan-binding domain